MRIGHVLGAFEMKTSLAALSTFSRGKSYGLESGHAQAAACAEAVCCARWMGEIWCVRVTDMLLTAVYL